MGDQGQVTLTTTSSYQKRRISIAPSWKYGVLILFDLIANLCFMADLMIYL